MPTAALWRAKNFDFEGVFADETRFLMNFHKQKNTGCLLSRTRQTVPVCADRGAGRETEAGTGPREAHPSTCSTKKCHAASSASIADLEKQLKSAPGWLEPREIYINTTDCVCSGPINNYSFRPSVGIR